MINSLAVFRISIFSISCWYIFKTIKWFNQLLCMVASIPSNIYLFKVNNGNTRKKCEICSKLTTKAPERRHSSVSIVELEQVNVSWFKNLPKIWLLDADNTLKVLIKLDIDKRSNSLVYLGRSLTWAPKLKVSKIIFVDLVSNIILLLI